MTEESIYEQGILVVDDEEIIAWAIREFLIREGFRNVWQVADGVEFVQFVRNTPHEVALALVDVNMPKLDGPGAVRQLSQEHAGVLGVMFMTGWPARDLRESWREMGNERVRVMDFFEKPFEMRKLLERIVEMLPRVLDAKREMGS